ncbi:hypothetical protein JRQ81_014419 [Phrynocephalus forsythii]|uniref:Dual specificity protein phosphatase 15 n=1 Tax=Phrynocephalus forsythii TaxID=171643 RepID=A0A9Q0XWP6_9SAUR|nr:hypothetical protein JRQ81_014419 [Phrynocephalus forsythii]
MATIMVCSSSAFLLDGKDLDQLSRHNITHVIAIHDSAQPYIPGITYLRIGLQDTPDANIKKHFKECIHFIHSCRLRGGSCLVHCLAGISRSTTIVVAYVMAVTQLSWHEALEAVKAVRPVANPNPGFRQQLEEYGSSQAAQKIHRQLECKYGASPFNDEEEIRALLPSVRRGEPCRPDVATPPIVVPRSKSTKGTDPFILRAWAIYKGKYQKGREDRPSVWKTRLRCALNKSSDFQEVPERSHLDISEPYKVYRISCEACFSVSVFRKREHQRVPGELSRPPASAHQGKRANGRVDRAERSSVSGQESKEEPAGISLAASPLGSEANPMPGPAEHQGYQVKGFFCSWNPAQFRCHRSPPFMGPDSHYTDAENINSDCWLHIRLFYCDVPVMEVTTRTAEGCRITFCPVRTDNAHLYGSSRVEQIQLPPPGVLSGNSRARGAIRVLEQLLPHLHRGVLLWVAPEGVFMKRQCQGRVYWKGPWPPTATSPTNWSGRKPTSC